MARADRPTDHRDRTRVTFVVDSDAFGGAEVHVCRLIRWLPADLRPSLVVSEQVVEHFAEVEDRIDALAVVPSARHCPTAPQIAEAVIAQQPDVVHLNLVDPGSNLACVRATDGVPAVATLHLQGAVRSDWCESYRMLRSVIAPSAVIAHQLTAELGLPADRVVRIRHGVPLPAEGMQRRDRSPLVVGTVGRLTSQKGFDLLLDAVVELNGRRDDFEVVIAGSGRDETELRRRAEGLPVRFLGLCRDVPALLRELDVFCLPSRREALSLALLEAAAHGLACVSTDVGDTAEALDGTALIVPPEDRSALVEALQRMLSSSKLRSELGRRARQRAVRDLDVRRMASETGRVLAEAARGSTEDGVDLTEHLLGG